MHKYKYLQSQRGWQVPYTYSFSPLTHHWHTPCKTALRLCTHTFLLHAARTITMQAPPPNPARGRSRAGNMGRGRGRGQAPGVQRGRGRGGGTTATELPIHSAPTNGPAQRGGFIGRGRRAIARGGDRARSLGLRGAPRGRGATPVTLTNRGTGQMGGRGRGGNFDGEETNGIGGMLHGVRGVRGIRGPVRAVGARSHGSMGRGRGQASTDNAFGDERTVDGDYVQSMAELIISQPMPAASQSNVNSAMSSRAEAEHRAEADHSGAEHHRREEPAVADRQLNHETAVEDRFTCCICMDTYRAPVVTTCFHIFCEKCYQDLRGPACPLCRAPLAGECMRDALFEQELTSAIARGLIPRPATPGPTEAGPTLSNTSQPGGYTRRVQRATARPRGGNSASMGLRGVPRGRGAAANQSTSLTSRHGIGEGTNGGGSGERSGRRRARGAGPGLQGFIGSGQASARDASF
ncbi:hypothetical protein C8R47DRAFT_709332 [Mycena vitilis]|nr:hypothetical protein C8R47DRAFT_709332 [Mycena vitilis]